MRFENIIANEELFIALHSIHLVGSSASLNLIETGYLTWDYQKTDKATQYVEGFYKKNKELVYYALLRYRNSRKNYLNIKMDCGIEKNATLEILLSRMVKEGLVQKFDDHEYKCM